MTESTMDESGMDTSLPTPTPDEDTIVMTTHAPVDDRPPRRRISRLLLVGIAIGLCLVGASVGLARQSTADRDEANSQRAAAEAAVAEQQTRRDDAAQQLTTTAPVATTLVAALTTPMATAERVDQIVDQDNDLVHQAIEHATGDSDVTYNRLVDQINALTDPFNKTIDEFDTEMGGLPR